MPKTIFFKFTGPDGEKYTLALKEKKFCHEYLKSMGNGVDAVYAAGYKPKSKNTAYVMASQNLRKPKIYQYINLKLKEHGFTDENVKKQHLYLINQFANLNAKKAAIDMYYKISGKYTPEKFQFVDPCEEFTDEEIEVELQRRINTGRLVIPKKVIQEYIKDSKSK